MTTYYVGAGGNNANDGLSWSNRKLTINGAEDVPVAAGDTVYVAPGVYREALTCDVSGSAGNPITYIGDYSGQNTDGVGGVVRITGSDDDISATRASGFAVGARDYRTFRGFLLDITSSYSISLTGTNVIVDQCAITNIPLGISCIFSNGATQAALTVTNSLICPVSGSGAGVYITHSATVNDVGHNINNCIFLLGSGATGVLSPRVGGITIKNCTFYGGGYGVRVPNALAAGQTVTVNNCVFTSVASGALAATATGEITENYNSIFGCNTPRSNTNAGANSNAYPPLFDVRWFFELVAGGNMLSPFDLASYSPLINVAGTSPTTTDMRGTAVQGAQREWGGLEFDSTLLIEEGAGGGGGVVRRVMQTLGV